MRDEFGIKIKIIATKDMIDKKSEKLDFIVVSLKFQYDVFSNKTLKIFQITLLFRKIRKFYEPIILALAVRKSVKKSFRIVLND